MFGFFKKKAPVVNTKHETSGTYKAPFNLANDVITHIAMYYNEKGYSLDDIFRCVEDVVFERITDFAGTCKLYLECKKSIDDYDKNVASGKYDSCSDEEKEFLQFINEMQKGGIVRESPVDITTVAYVFDVLSWFYTFVNQNNLSYPMPYEKFKDYFEHIVPTDEERMKILRNQYVNYKKEDEKTLCENYNYFKEYLTRNVELFNDPVYVDFLSNVGKDGVHYEPNAMAYTLHHIAPYYASQLATLYGVPDPEPLSN